MLCTVLMLFVFTGCATVGSNSSLTPVQQAQQAAEQTVDSLGVALQAVPPLCESLYAAGQISKETYNKITPVYNQALGSYKLLLVALRESIVSNNDPNKHTAYLEAVNRFLLDKQMLESLTLALLGTTAPAPVGGK